MLSKSKLINKHLENEICLSQHPLECQCHLFFSFTQRYFSILLSISIDCTFGITYEWNKTEVYPCTCLKFMHVCVCVLSLSMILLIPNNCTSYALPNQVGIQAFGTGLSFSFYLISILILETDNRTLSSFDGRMAYLFWIEEYIGIAIRGTQLTNTIHWIEWECSLYRSIFSFYLISILNSNFRNRR